MSSFVINAISEVQIKAAHKETGKADVLWAIVIDDTSNGPLVVESFYQRPLSFWFSRNTSNQWVVNVETITDPLWRENGNKARWQLNHSDSASYVLADAPGSGGGTIVSLKMSDNDIVMSLSADIGPDASPLTYLMLLATDGKVAGEYCHEVHIRPL